MILAIARLNRLAVRDVITAPLRGALANHTTPAARWATALLMCHWCTGIWISAALCAWAHHAMNWPWDLYPLTALAAAHAASVLTDLADGWLER